MHLNDFLLPLLHSHNKVFLSLFLAVLVYWFVYKIKLFMIVKSVMC